MSTCNAICPLVGRGLEAPFDALVELERSPQHADHQRGEGQAMPKRESEHPTVRPNHPIEEGVLSLFTALEPELPPPSV